jgi:transcriptional regulator with XRE-family HTH domain
VINPSEYLPENLKKLRADRKWGLARAADETGVSKAMLGQIERGESSPTLSTLWKIATGFDISFSELVRNPQQKQSHTQLTDSAQERKAVADDGMLVSIVQSFDSSLGFEWFEITFPGGYERQSAPHKQGVTEFISVLKGRLQLNVGGDLHMLSAGQTIRFDGCLEHTYGNPSKTETIVHCLMHYAEAT